MPITIQNGYKVRLLQTKAPLLNRLKVGLATNLPEISGATVLGDFTEYAPTSGYSRLSPAPWGPAFLAASGKGQMPSASMTFGPTVGLPTAIRCVFAVDENGFLALASPIAAPVAVLLGGPLLSYVVQLTLFEDTMLLV